MAIYGPNRTPLGTTSYTTEVSRRVVAVTMGEPEPQPPPASGLVGALPVALCALMMPTFGSTPISPEDLAALGGRFVSAMANILLEGVVDVPHP